MTYLGNEKLSDSEFLPSDRADSGDLKRGMNAPILTHVQRPLNAQASRRRPFCSSDSGLIELGRHGVTALPNRGKRIKVLVN